MRKPKSAKCSISWCSEKVYAHQFCKSHYRRYRRKLNPITINYDFTQVEKVARYYLSLLEVQALKLHRSSSHKFEFTVCASGFCAEFHQAKKLMETTNHAPQDPFVHTSTDPS